MQAFSKPFKFRRDSKGNVKLWASKLVLPFDHALGYQPRPVVLTAANIAALKDKIVSWEPTKPTLDKQTTLVEYVEKTFIPNEERRTHVGTRPLQTSTYKNRRGRLMKWLVDGAELSFLKDAPILRATLARMTPEVVGDYYRRLEDGKASWETRNQLRTDLGLIFNAAEALMPDARYFKFVKIEAKPDANVQMYDLDQVVKIINDEAKPLELRVLVAFQFSVMCRPSEMWPLSWSDFSGDYASVTFDKAEREIATGRGVTPGLKSSREKRVGIPPWLGDMLRALRKTRMAQGMGQEAVFLTAETPAAVRMTKNTFGHRWTAYKAILGLPAGPVFYSLKHLGNSWLDEQGVGAAVRQKRMGHKDDRMARNVYRRVRDSEMDAATQAFDSVSAASR